MQNKNTFSIIIMVVFCFILAGIVRAETKMDTPSGGIFPKLPKTPDDPILENSQVYPSWGAPCTRYTYSVVYRDEKGRAPEYVKMYFNGKWLNIEKENSADNDYQKGVKYIYKFVPTSTESNFYFFEASNGKGKARDGIIDSPDNGPVLFTSPLNKNEIVVFNREDGEFVWRYSTGEEWVAKVAISQNSEYLAAKTSQHVYLFNIEQGEPIWEFSPNVNIMIGDNVDGGIDISADGERIVAILGSGLYLFSNESGEPLWQYDLDASTYGVSVSPDGSTIAVAVAASPDEEKSNLLILFDEKGNELWRYQSSGNFHSADLSQDGAFIAAATGCPDRRVYIFSRDSSDPILRSEMLTRDSPVHASAISDDGQFAAFGSESDQGGVHFFITGSKGNSALWKFPMPNDRSVRALSMTPDGQYIGAGSFGGDAYIFKRDSNTPIQHYNVKTRLGAVDISDDGSWLAVGGSDKKVYLFQSGSGTPPARGGDGGGGSGEPRWSQELNEFLNTVDVSSNGEYIAAGTGGSVYFFESDEFNLPKNEVCSKIIEPPAQPSGMIGDDSFQGEADLSGCGDGKCNQMKGENKETCPKDCKPFDFFGKEEPEDQSAKTEKPKGFPWIVVIPSIIGLLAVSGGVVLFILWRKGKIFRRK